MMMIKLIDRLGSGGREKCFDIIALVSDGIIVIIFWNGVELFVRNGKQPESDLVQHERHS
jgi:hypothetical protein